MLLGAAAAGRQGVRRDGKEVSLRARYELVSDGVMIETLTAQDGSPVDRIVFHKVSRD